MLFYKFVLINFFIFILPKASCNLIIHPSLADFFVESFRDNIYISSNNVINKKLSSPFCCSCDGLYCHNINKENIEIEKKVVKKKEICDEEEEIKYIYLHTSPFYTTIKEETVNKAEKEGNNRKHNIFYKFFYFLLGTFSFFTKTDKIQKSKKFYSYFIDKNKTNILNNSDDLPNNNKYKIKGHYLGENLGNIRNLSFLSPLSLAIDEIDFNQIFKHAWDKSYSNLVFLKNSSGSYTDKKSNSIERSSLIKEKDYLSEKNSEYMNKKNGNQEDKYEDENNIDNNGDTQLKRPSYFINKDDNILLKYIMKSNEDSEYLKILKKIENEISLNTANSILKKLNIQVRNNFDEVFKNNKNLNVGICTREKKQKISLQMKKMNLKAKTLDNLLLKKKKKNGNYIFGCAFFHSIENSELIFELKKSISHNDSYTQPNSSSHTKYNEEFSKNYKKDQPLFVDKKSNEYIKVSDNIIYKDWKIMNLNKSKLSMLSSNILSNLKKYKDYNYNKSIFKLQIDYNGVCKNVVFIYEYNKKMLLDFLFQLDVCYNNNYINKNILFNYLNTNIRANFILKGVWNYGNVKNIINIESYINNLKSDNYNNNIFSKNRNIKYNSDYSNQSYVHENFFIYNDLYDFKSADDREENLIDDNLRFNDKGTIYLYEQVLDSKVQPSERYKRMKLLNIQNNILEEKRQHTFLINNIIKGNNDVLLLSKKGSIEFETPIVLSELYVGFHYNPSYEFFCKKNNSKINSDVNLIYNKNTKYNYLNEYMNNISCNYSKLLYIYIFFNFFLNNNKKYNLKLEVNIDHLKKFRSSKDTPFKYLNVLNYLKSNINYYRINKIEIEYSFSPFLERNKYIDHPTLPFYISINNLIINQSRKVYNYVPIFYTNKINFLQVLSRNAKNKVKKKSDKIKDMEHIKKENNSYVLEEVSEEDNDNEEKLKNENELYSTKFPKLFQNEQSTEKQYYNSIWNNNNNYINFNSFSLFTSINENIFLKHVMQYNCTINKCIYGKNTIDFLLNNLKKDKKKKNVNYKRGENLVIHKHLNFSFEPIIINPFFEFEENIKEEKLSEIQNEYFNFLKTDLSKYLKEGTKNIVAYNMKNLYTFEFINKKYVIPPYNKGIFINFEVKNEKIYHDPYNQFSYIKQELKENIYNDTRKVFDIIYIYSALLPAESDLFDFNYLSKNKLTLKKVQSENAKALFKNIIPFTRYEDFYELNHEFSQNVLDLNILDFKNNSLNNELINLTLDANLYKAKIVELMQSKLKGTMQLNSEEKT